MSRLLITGGCGFIGSNLIAHLQANGGPEIRVFDNESLGSRAHIAEFDIEFVQGDIRDEAAVCSAVKGVDAVVHLAADTRVIDSIENPSQNFDVNVRGSFNLFSAMRAAGVTRVVSASTGGAILGEAAPPVHEDIPPRPLAPYGASKLAVEGYCSAFNGSYGFSATSLRFSNIYGPRSYHKGSVVAAFLKRIMADEEVIVYGDGKQIRDYVFVEDICRGITQALTTESPGVYQLGSGKPTTLRALIDMLQEAIGTEREIRVRYEKHRNGEILETWCDISNARRALGYTPAIDLPDGLRRTWEWFQSAGGSRHGVTQ